MIKYKDKITGGVYRLLAQATRVCGDKCENVIVYYPAKNKNCVLVMDWPEFNDTYEEMK